MSILIDNREIKVIEILRERLGESFNNIVKLENLNLGDFIINDIIIERKTIDDLASSIKDGRYKEQSNRLSEELLNNKRIYYFLEGRINKMTKGIKKETIISCIYSLTYTENFNLIRTADINETCDFIMQFYNKNKSNIKGYSSKLKKKNKNINRDTISEYMLCQIPGISKVNSDIILNRFNNINNFIVCLNNDNKLLENFRYITSNKEKKLNKNIIENINLYLRY